MNFLYKFTEKLKEYREISKVDEIARRYFAMNGFDGSLTILGLLIGYYLTNFENPIVIFTTGISTCVAMGISGLWGAYLTERSERISNIRELEKATISNLNNTKIGSAHRFATIVVAIIDAVAPFVTALFSLIPFLFTKYLDIRTCYYISFALTFTALFALGVFLGRISKENLFISGMKMVIAGIVSVLISVLLIRNF